MPRHNRCLVQRMKVQSPFLKHGCARQTRIFHARRALSTRAMTLIEIICVIVTFGMLVALFLPMLARPRRHTTDMRCRYNLKNIGLAYRIWAVDNNDLFPFEVSTNKGGSLEMSNDLAAQFLVLSNEIFTPKTLICPRDYALRVEATNWDSLGPQNISFFVGLDGSQTNVDSILSGDTGFTINGGQAPPGIQRLTATARIEYPKDLHTKPDAVNICMGDGSVPQTSAKKLPQLLAKSHVAINRFILP
jgi:competence protein ComGC